MKNQINVENNINKNNFISKFLLFAFFAFSITLFAFLIRDSLKTFIIIIPVFIVILFLLIKFNKDIFKNLDICNLKKVYITLLVLGILLRILLLLFNYIDITDGYGDYTTFYNNAVAFATNSPMNVNYIAMFPYLFGYISWLGMFFKIFGYSMINVTIFNILTDLLGCYFLYKFLKNLYNQKTAKIGTIVWILNPFGILWCVVPSPVIIVNSTIMLCLYIFSLLIKNLFNIKD